MFMHSILITGGTKEKRRNFANEKAALPPNSPDLKIIRLEEGERSIGISDVRKIQNFLTRKPYQSSHKAVVIEEAQHLTEDAQNAILKTLEEPPEHSLIILTADHTTNLLPTITSRCEIIKLPVKIDLEIESPFHQKVAQEFINLLTMNSGERLQWVEENKELIKEADSALKILLIWESIFRDLLLLEKCGSDLVINKDLIKNVDLKHLAPSTKHLESTIKQLSRTINILTTTSANPRLTVELSVFNL